MSEERLPSDPTRARRGASFYMSCCTRFVLVVVLAACMLAGCKQGEPDLPRRALWPAALTCVGVVKRILGVRAPWVLTPWQLFRHLSRGPAAWRTAANESLDMPI